MFCKAIPSWLKNAVPVASVVTVVLLPLVLQAVTLETDALRINFGDSDSGFGIRGIINRLSGETMFGAAAGGNDLWEIRFSRKGAITNEYVTLSNRSVAGMLDAVRETNTLRLYWKGLDLPGEPRAVDVEATVRLTETCTSEWKIEIANRSRAWTQHTVDYPIIRKVMPEGTGTALLPWKNLGGRLFRNYDSRKSDRRGPFHVPGAYMPMAAFMRGDAGLYVAAHDGEQRLKCLRVSIGPDVRFSTVLENAGVVGKAASGPKYAVTVAVFKGDWWEAAHIYRDWALKQTWCRKGKIAFRSDYPKIAAETDLWPTTGGSASNMIDRIAHLKKTWPGMNVAVGWSDWYLAHPGNRMNPEFFPLRDSLIPTVAKDGRAEGFHFMPYVNGRIWDKSLAGFNYAKTDATTDENGELYDEVYSADHFGVMCPTRPVWQMVVRQLGRRIIDDFGADMAYFDQVSCSRGLPCFNPEHGHPLGGGSWWADGYRKMFEAVHDDFAKHGAVVTSEQLGEAWLDVIDAYLNASEMTEEDVPLFPAVYQGYCIHFGRRVGCNAPHQTTAWRFLQDAKTVLWGEAPGWIGAHVFILNHYRDEAENLLKVAKFRRAHADFLVYGSLENEVRLDEPDSDVYGTIWKDANGKRTAVAFVNASAVVKRVRYRCLDEAGTREIELMPMCLRMEEF